MGFTSVQRGVEEKVGELLVRSEAPGFDFNVHHFLTMKLWATGLPYFNLISLIHKIGIIEIVFIFPTKLPILWSHLSINGTAMLLDACVTPESSLIPLPPHVPASPMDWTTEIYPESSHSPLLLTPSL